jgi:hypothetical protein
MSVPSKFHTAYNPVLFTFEDDGTEYAELDINIGGTNITLKRDWINGTATFDISSIIKSYFAERPTTGSDIRAEPMLYVPYSVGSNSYIAINAVVQLGDSLDYSTMKNTALTTLDTIKLYDGYELDISVLSDNPALELSEGTCIANAVNIISVTSIGSITSVPLTFATLGGDTVLTLGEDTIQVSDFDLATIETGCVPLTPFYIRWNNYKGGRDYWMFSYNQRRVISLVENQTYQKYITDYTENGTDWSYFKKAIEAVTVGAELLTLNDYNALVKMTLSPYIEVFDGVWKRIIIDSASNERGTKEPLNQFECTFLLPELNLQY